MAGLRAKGKDLSSNGFLRGLPLICYRALGDRQLPVGVSASHLMSRDLYACTTVHGRVRRSRAESSRVPASGQRRATSDFALWQFSVRFRSYGPSRLVRAVE